MALSWLNVWGFRSVLDNGRSRWLGGNCLLQFEEFAPVFLPHFVDVEDFLAVTVDLANFADEGLSGFGRNEGSQAEGLGM